MPNDEGNRKIVVVFRVKIKAALEEEYERRLGEESLHGWRNHPVHQEAMKEGREKLYTWYSVQVCREPEHRGRMPA